MEWYLKVVRDNYANFNGRARRKEYWMFYLFNMIFVFAIMAVDLFLGLNFVLYAIYLIAMIVPGLAVSVRRLHDTGKSGWFLLIALIPMIGPIIGLVFLCTDSNPEENEYGPCPK